MERKVTALKIQKRNPNRVNVYLDGEYAFGLAKILGAGLHVGQFLTEEKISELQAEDAYEEALQKAYHFLSYRPRSEAEVRQNLEKHQVPAAVIEAVLRRLRELDFANDQKFAHLWVENRTEFRPRGQRQLRMELRQKGVDEQEIEQALENLDENALALQAAQQRAARLRGLPANEFKQKLSAHLARRGFTYDAISRAVRQAWEENQDKSIDQNEETPWNQEP